MCPCLLGGCAINFYKHHIGDYAQATAHLTFVEDAAYSRLLRKYYAEEKPLPADLRTVQRLVGARTKEEKEAVETVLREFFSQHDDGWHNKRADEEILRASAQAEANRRVAEEREAKRRERTKNESSTNRAADVHESLADREPSQTPDSRHQTPVEEERARKRATRQCPEDFKVTEDLAAWAAEKVPAVALSVETEKFRDYTFPRAISDWPGAWRNWMRKAAEMGSKGSVVRHPAVNKQLALEAENRRVGEEWARMMKGEIA